MSHAGKIWSVCLGGSIAALPQLSAAIGPGPGQSDKSGDLFLVVLAFPVLTALSAAGAVLFRTPADGARVVLRGFLGAAAGLAMTAALAALLMASSARDAGFLASSVLMLGAIPAGLVGLIVGGLVAVARGRRKPGEP